MTKAPLRIKLVWASLLMIFVSSVLLAQSKVRVYHFSVDGEKCDKKVPPNDLKKIQETIKAWEAFDYKKTLFDTFRSVKAKPANEELLPTQGIPGVSIKNDDCRILFGFLEEGLYCAWGNYKLKLTEKETKIALPDTKIYRYLTLEDEKGRAIWKRKSPAWGGRTLWELPVLPMPNEAGICFLDYEMPFRIPVLYVLDIKTGKTVLILELSSEEDFGGYLPRDYSKWDFKPFYKDGFIVYKTTYEGHEYFMNKSKELYKKSYEGSEYFQNKYKDTPLVVIDLRPLLEK
jgi:hypothetical protein